MALTVLGVVACGAGCAQRQGAERTAQATHPTPATTRPSDPALLSLDEIHPRPLLTEIVAAAAECVLDWERHGIVEAMNRCNRRHEPATASDIERDCTIPVRPQTEMTNHTGAIPRSPLSVATGAYNRAVEWWTRQRNHAGDERVDQRK